MAKDTNRKGAIKAWDYVVSFLGVWFWERAAQIGMAQNQSRLTRYK